MACRHPQCKFFSSKNLLHDAKLSQSVSIHTVSLMPLASTCGQQRASAVGAALPASSRNLAPYLRGSVALQQKVAAPALTGLSCCVTALALGRAARSLGHSPAGGFCLFQPVAVSAHVMQSSNAPFVMLRVALIVVLACATLVHARYLNVHGDPLQKCSRSGMALTGFTRSGECYMHDDDHGSHHVCIDLSSTTGGNFCSVTVPAPPLHTTASGRDCTVIALPSVL
jgi:hypothetical protein